MSRRVVGLVRAATNEPVETLFGKMARSFLRHLLVEAWEELQPDILQGIAEIPAPPVVHRGKKFEARPPDRMCRISERYTSVVSAK